FPELFPGCGFEAFDDFLVTKPMKEDKRTAGDNRSAESGTDLLSPQNGWTRDRPHWKKPLFERVTIPRRAQELWPVGAESALGQQGHEEHRRFPSHGSPLEQRTNNSRFRVQVQRPERLFRSALASIFELFFT